MEQRLLQSKKQKRPILRVLVLAITFSTLSLSMLSDAIDSHLVFPSLFKLRHALQKSPHVSKDLKIYYFDDFAARNLKKDDLSKKDWENLIVGFTKANPRLIMISSPFFTHQENVSFSQLEQIDFSHKVPIYAGAFVQGGRKKSLNTLALNHRVLKLNGKSVKPTWDLTPTFPYIYAAPDNLLRYFKGVGHSNYTQSTSINPFFRTAKDSFIPHLSLHAAKKIEIKNNALFINDHNAHLNRSGHMAINFIPYKDLQKVSYSLFSAIKRSSEGLPAATNIEGKTILILDRMTSGKTSFLETPLGVMPSPYIIAMLVNAILTNDFIENTAYQLIFIILACLLAGFIGVRLKPIWFWMAFPTAIVALFSISVLSFAYLGYLIPFFWLLVSFVVTSIMEFSIKLRNQQHNLNQQLTITETEQKMLVSTLELAHLTNHLKSRLRAIKNIEMAYHFKPADSSGGDWIWAHHDSEVNRLYIFVGDVSGHGVQSTLVTLAVSGAIQSALSLLELKKERDDIQSDLSSMIHCVDRTVKDMAVLTGKMMTMTLLAIDVDTGKSTYANCAHTPVLWAKEDQVASLLVKGWPLGMNEKKWTPKTKDFQLQPGDLLLAYTDGLVENTGMDGKRLGYNRLKRALSSELSAYEAKKAILDKAESIWLGRKGADDCSFIVFKFLGFGKDFRKKKVM